MDQSTVECFDKIFCVELKIGMKKYSVAELYCGAGVWCCSVIVVYFGSAVVEAAQFECGPSRSGFSGVNLSPRDSRARATDDLVNILSQ